MIYKFYKNTQIVSHIVQELHSDTLLRHWAAKMLFRYDGSVECILCGSVEDGHYTIIVCICVLTFRI